MSSVEITQSAILSLKAKALESYGIIKHLLKRPPQEGIANEIATEALRLVQYEGAALTLNQYFGNGLPAEEEPKTPAPEETPPPREESKTIVVTEEMSPTYKRSIQKEKIKATAQKRRVEDRNEDQYGTFLR